MQATTILRSESVIEKLREVEGRGIHVVLLEYPAAACVLAKMKDSWISTRYHRGRKTLMSSGWLIFGTIAQLMLAYLLFMVVVFSAAGMGRTANLGRLQLAVLNFLMYVLPALCVLSAGIVLYLYKHAGSAASYWWYALPLAATALYLVYAISLSSRS
jgi:hypothetical protein